jgi:hypothetical protein
MAFRGLLKILKARKITEVGEVLGYKSGLRKGLERSDKVLRGRFLLFFRVLKGVGGVEKGLK